MLARLFDASEDPKEQWRPCRGEHTPSWCRVYGDRMPASLINARSPWLYSKGDSPLAGFIVNPSAVSLMCSYFTDGSSMNKLCDPPGKRDDCLPGCPTGHDDTRWCRSREQTQCGWQPNQLDQMLMQQWEQSKSSYNEVVLDSERWDANLPHTISAVFYPAYASQDKAAHARQVHAAFLARYRLDSSTVPLLVFDPIAGRQVGKPFAPAPPE